MKSVLMNKNIYCIKVKRKFFSPAEMSEFKRVQTIKILRVTITSGLSLSLYNACMFKELENHVPKACVFCASMIYVTVHCKQFIELLWLPNSFTHEVLGWVLPPQMISKRS